MATSRVRLWADATHYFDLDFCALGVVTSEPKRRMLDRIGVPHEVVPTDSAELKSWSISAALSIPSRYCYHLSSGASTVPLYSWLYTYAREAQTEFYIFADAYGTDSGGSAVNDRKFYKGRLAALPDWLIGLRTGLGGGVPPYLTLSIPCISDEGSFSDFSNIASITTRGTRPV